MEDKKLYMISNNNCLPYLNVDFETYIFIGAFKNQNSDKFLVEKDFEDEIYSQLIFPIEFILDENYFVNEKGIIEEYNVQCKHCNSKKHIKKGYNERLLHLENGISIRVKVKRYECKKCKRKFQVEFPKHWGKYCNFSNKIKNKTISLLQHGWKSLRNIGNDFKELIGLNISHESIRKYLTNENDLYWLNEDLKLSGYFAFDAQWVRINRKWHYRLVIFDIINNIPVACQISDDETSNTVKDFINKSIPYYNRKAIITDLKQEYDLIMKDLGFAHQHCTFHLIKSMYNSFKPEITKILNEYKNQLLNENPKISKKLLKEKTKKKKSEIYEELEHYENIFYDLFNQKSFNKAVDYIDYLKRELHKFPQMMQDYLNKNFFPNYRKFLVFLEKPYIGKLESTNNKIENYFGNTLDKHTKRIYRTKQGIFNYIMARKDGWIKNQNKVLTN